MKKSVAILLLLSLTAPLLGTYVILQFRKNMIRKEVAGIIHAGPDKKTLVKLKVPAEEVKSGLKWKRDGEFEFKGQMYDVVETIRSGDSTVYICYKDQKETRLKNQVAQMVNEALGHDPCQKSQTDKLTDFFKTVYHQNLFAWKPPAPQTSIFNFSFIIFNYSSLFLSPPAPPPKLG